MPFKNIEEMRNYQNKYKKRHYKENKQYYKDKAKRWKKANAEANKEQQQFYRIVNGREIVLKQRVKRYRKNHSYLRTLLWRLFGGHKRMVGRRIVEI